MQLVEQKDNANLHVESCLVNFSSTLHQFSLSLANFHYILLVKVCLLKIPKRPQDTENFSHLPCF